ncbi:hypothetical protein [Actinophytocola oryzae]|uniref:YggT family protein n=1 Tax=Actinophytocola oryzae TaxID=502181 RepID=A0A4R7VZL1_9PSEU|nr:hypothetical protein [Actinophytocola oryzae]TDV55225.1 hypothetical protein CLV71_103466 [Actinophytocola oryzae]
MNRPIDPDRTRLDLNPAAEPPPRVQPPVAAQGYEERYEEAAAPRYEQPIDEQRYEQHVAGQPVVEQERVTGDPDQRRRRTVGIVCTVINVLCAVFAVVLALHIILVLGSANQSNGFAGLINDWSSAVSLGLRDLFVPANEKIRTFLNDGLAAIAWLAIGALLTFLIRRFALPVPRRVSQYRRVTR